MNREDIPESCIVDREAFEKDGTGVNLCIGGCGDPHPTDFPLGPRCADCLGLPTVEVENYC